MLAVFDWDGLSRSLQENLLAQTDGIAYSQVLLFGHGGRSLWPAVEGRIANEQHPIDNFSTELASAFVEEYAPNADYRVLYPADACAPPLISLGTLAGWHRPSPFLLGINSQWGSWFAYRALVVADTQLPTTAPLAGESPCLGCPAPCIDACPADAVSHSAFDMTACVTHRLEDNSSCAATCLSRTACPIGKNHQYDGEQMSYHYRLSLATIRAW